MTIARPQTIGSDLFAKVEALLLQEGEPSVFVLRALRAQADKLAEASAVDASIARSGISAYEWDEEKAAYWINNALALEKSPETYINASVTSRLINNFELSVEYARKACEVDARRSDIAMYACDSFHINGYFSEAIDVLKSFQHEAAKTRLGNVEDRLRGLSEAGFTEQDLQKELHSAARVARLNRKRIVAIGHSFFIDPEEGPVFRTEIKFKGDFHDEMKLEAEFARMLCDMPHWNPVKLSVEFSHYVHNELQPH